jgi:hypothetical protein
MTQTVASLNLSLSLSLSLFPQRDNFDSRRMYMGFMVNKLALKPGGIREYWFSPTIKASYPSITVTVSTRS